MIYTEIIINTQHSILLAVYSADGIGKATCHNGEENKFLTVWW